MSLIFLKGMNTPSRDMTGVKIITSLSLSEQILSRVVKGQMDIITSREITHVEIISSLLTAGKKIYSRFRADF